MYTHVISSGNGVGFMDEHCNLFFDQYKLKIKGYDQIKPYAHTEEPILAVNGLIKNKPAHELNEIKK